MKALLKPELIPNWKSAWRFWSVRLAIAGSAITGILIASPEAAMFAWNQLPEDLKSQIPPRYTAFIGVGVYVLSIVARMMKQPNLPPAPTADENPQNTGDK